MEDKTVLITGASSGIGRATAETFEAEGWTVYATARDTDDIEGLAEAGCVTQELDVTEPEHVEAAVERVIEDVGRLDCLVNNAGYAQFGPLEDVPTDRVHDQFDVNVYGPHRLIREALPHMREQGEGTIVNVSSVAGRVATPGMGVYNGSKFALEGLTDALRGEVDDYGVDAVLIEPGPVDTNFDERADEELENGTERSGAYDSIYAFYEEGQTFGGTSALSVPPTDVAETILEAACSPDPDPRYPVGQLAKYSSFLRFVPDRLRDGAYRLVKKLA
ncbi:SDR family oxidoreductase [Halorientalis regularis]|jgi:NAD(P)-dependent dehydrogenase (short-subunit alcohol dehydrogenase family)|uniref:NADP-dependent 3-hydroxy acid dehydrogenase YdfG n=1 Tax=Halorientalis regularis TaxID=660518 RepID=A0A1G7SG87_9EURY|nr:SDR family oxidoreductase [Halorientalis regularis]SDG22013.1 NADP-dependent 3-hydroxy acid dehydrogenase YdfG [Halorientalis regularis]